MYSTVVRPYIMINENKISITPEQASFSIEYAKRIIGDNAEAIKYFKKKEIDFSILGLKDNFDSDPKSKPDVANYFLITLSSLVMSVVLSAYFTFKAGKEAYQTRQELQALKVNQFAHRNIYDPIVSILTATYTDQCCKAVFSFCFVPGCALLTATIVLVIFGLITSSPLAPCINNLAIVGGSCIGVGLVGHWIVRPLIRTILSNELMDDYLDLLNNVKAINSEEVHLEIKKEEDSSNEDEEDWSIVASIEEGEDGKINLGNAVSAQKGNT